MASAANVNAVAAANAKAVVKADNANAAAAKASAAATEAAEAARAATAPGAPANANATAARAAEAAKATSEAATAKAAEAARAATAAQTAATAAPTAAVPAATAAVPAATSSGMRKWLEMLGVITVESGLGFSAGWSMGKNQIGPIIATLVLISIVFALEFWMRYGYGETPGWALPGGIFALVAASVVPYMTMSRAGKGKAKDTATFIPTVFAVWATVAIVFGMAVARPGSRADALQGIILSLLYAAVTAAGGFSVAKGGAAAASTGVFAGMMWMALLIFDMAGLARGPATNSTK